MSHFIGKDLYIIVLLAGLLMAAIGDRFGYTQTNLQASQNRVAELEKKLADAKVRQEKAQSVQMQLEEQEQKLVGLEKYLSESDKYRVQVVEIRVSIKSICAKIEAIAKEKNDWVFPWLQWPLYLVVLGFRPSYVFYQCGVRNWLNGYGLLNQPVEKFPRYRDVLRLNRNVYSSR